MKLFEGRDEVDVTWRSFELEPDLEHELEGDFVQHLADKFGTTRQQAQSRLDDMTELAAKDGLDLRFDLTRRGNTFDAHRLIQLGAHHGIQDAVK